MPPNRTVPIDRPLTAIRLAKEWALDETRSIGVEEDFVDILDGWASDGAPVTIRRILRKGSSLFKDEVTAARALMAEHPEHVLPILDAGTDAITGNHYIVMPSAEHCLSDRLNRDGPMVDEDAMAVLCDVLLGLNEMRDSIHGDLRPANVMFHESKWQLADLALARAMAARSAEAPSGRVFSEPFAAPEQWRHEAASRATDVYAFGCLAYAVLTGRPPFHGPTRDDYRLQHLSEMPRALPAAAPVQALVQMCLNKIRGSRPSIDTALVLVRRAWSKHR